jgi:hypothetical protein
LLLYVVFTIFEVFSLLKISANTIKKEWLGIDVATVLDLK